VYEMDIRDYGFDFVSLGKTNQIGDDGLASVNDMKVKEAAEQMAELLTDADAYNRVVQHNFQIGKSNFSHESLHLLLEPLIKEVNR
jgi:hypothetical protein